MKRSLLKTSLRAGLIAFVMSSARMMAQPVVLPAEIQYFSAAVPLSSLPNSGGGDIRTFVVTYNNVTVGQWVNLKLNVWPQLTNSCHIGAGIFSTAEDGRPITLFDDDGSIMGLSATGWIIPPLSNSAQFDENASCRVYRSGSSVAMSGSSVTLTVRVEAREPFSGTRYGYAVGNGSPWTPVNYKWVVSGQTLYVPEPVQMSPTAGSAPSGTDVSFTATMRDWNGALNMWHSEIVFGRNDDNAEPWLLDPARTCWVIAELNANYLHFRDGSQWVTPGSAEQTISNNRCAVTIPAMNAQPPMIEVLDAYSVRLRFKVKFLGNDNNNWGPNFPAVLKSHLWPVDNQNAGTWSKNNGPWTVGGSTANDAFTLRIVPGLQHVARGETVRYSVTASSNGYAGSVNLTSLTVPGATATVSPAAIAPGQTAIVTVTSNSSASIGPAPMTVTGTAGTRSVTTGGTLEVEQKTYPIETLSLNEAGDGNPAWEATTAAGADGTWAMGWRDLSESTTATLAVYDGDWKRTKLTGIDNDTNLAWDPVQNRFVFVVVKTDFSVWYGYRGADGNWVLNCPSPMPRENETTGEFKRGWDFPSIAVRRDGRIAIGAVERLNGGGGGYVAKVSAGPVSGCPFWGDEKRLSSNSGVGRIVASGDDFIGFTTTTGTGNSLATIRKWTRDNNTEAWIADQDLLVNVEDRLAEVFSNPAPGAPRVFFGKLFSVAGLSIPGESGKWVLAYQQKHAEAPFNNVYVCGSGFACTAAEATDSAHQFLPEVAMTADGHWLSFFKFDATDSSKVNVRLRYTPHSGPSVFGWLGYPDVNMDSPLIIDPRGWTDVLPTEFANRCFGLPCRALGDYNTVAAATVAANARSQMSMPLVLGVGEKQKQAIVQDPPSDANKRVVYGHDRR